MYDIVAFFQLCLLYVFRDNVMYDITAFLYLYLLFVLRDNA